LEEPQGEKRPMTWDERQTSQKETRERRGGNQTEWGNCVFCSGPGTRGIWAPSKFQGGKSAGHQK